jgi:hypothetical protein
MKGASFLAALCALALPSVASARSYSSDWPFLGSTRIATPAGKPAAGLLVTVYPDVKEHRFVVAHPVWQATTNARGRIVLRAPFRGMIQRGAQVNGGWVNFMATGLTKRHLLFWEFPAQWTGDGWLVEPDSLPRTITLL